MHIQEILEEKLNISERNLRKCFSQLRFFWDFFGNPINDAGYHPTNIQFNGQEISNKDYIKITEYPTLRIDELMNVLSREFFEGFIID